MSELGIFPLSFAILALNLRCCAQTAPVRKLSNKKTSRSLRLVLTSSWTSLCCCPSECRRVRFSNARVAAMTDANKRALAVSSAQAAMRATSAVGQQAALLVLDAAFASWGEALDEVACLFG